MKYFSTILSLTACAFLGSACSSDEADGTLLITAYGESYIEDGIPSAEVEDGWEVNFEHFKVTIEDVIVGEETLTNIEVIDLTKKSSGDGQELGALLLPAGKYTTASFAITQVEAEGEATKGKEKKTFHWIFDRTTEYTKCKATSTIKAGEADTLQITVHADHLLYDSLVAEEPSLLFGPLAAADADDDGEITQEELKKADIGDYDPGSDDGVDDLWAYLSALSTTLGHVNGEGHCSSRATD